MGSVLTQLATEDLRQLRDALRAGRLVAPFSSFAVRRFVPERWSIRTAADLENWSDSGFNPSQIAEMLEILVQEREQCAKESCDIDLVWTGPEVGGVVNRDTSVVVRELFQNARKSVLVAGYVVYQGQVIFRTLAEQMDRNDQLEVRMFLDIQRPYGDASLVTELVRRFAERFRSQEWPGMRVPDIYYDPRSLETDNTKRACLHAKCIVVDRERTFISSANFTEAAQQRNIEVGVIIKSRSFSERLSHHFEVLAAVGVALRLPLK